jgi:hypothetical protein
MAGRASAKYSRNVKARRCGVVMGGALSAFVAAAAMATGSAAPAKADFEDLLDPIIQPLLASLTDSVAAFDPAAAVDLTSWTDSLLSSLNSIDVALPAAAEPASAVAASAEPAAGVSGTYDLPITTYEDTEPTVLAAVDGGSSVPVLVDTGSSGLVIPWEDLGSGSEFQDLLDLGFPTSFGESGYSGGVDYLYLTYDLPVTYADGLETTTPVEVEVYSWDPSDFSSFFTNDAFQGFLADNDSAGGILGIGDATSGGAGESPFEAAGFGGVTVDEPAHELYVQSTPETTGISLTASGSTVSGLTETVTSPTGTTSATVSDDLDSGGVYGTIPSSLAPSGELPDGDTVTVTDGNTVLYSYTVANDGANQLPNESPTAVTGDDIDSGYQAFEYSPISIDYNTDTLYVDR